MNNFLTENSNVSYLLNINQGELTINNSIFQNFDSLALFFITKGSNNQMENYNLSIFGCTFMNMTLENADFIYINESFNFVKIFESKFKYFSSQNILINSMSVQNQIEFRSLKFIENCLKNNIYIEGANTLLLSNLTFFKNNFNQKDKYYSFGEACLFIKNVLLKIFIFLNIILSKSLRNAPGLIITEESDFQLKYSYSKNYIFNISHSNFQHNYFSLNSSSKYPGTAIYLNTYSIISIITCIFTNNTMELDMEIQMTIGGACINSLNLYIVNVFNCSFILNKSNKLSNCLTIDAWSFYVNNSIFLNNSILGVPENILFLKRRDRFWFDDDYFSNLTFSSLNYGGAIFFSGCNFIVLSSYFVGNNAYNGGAIYVKQSDYISSNGTILINQCFFSYNSALLDGAAFYINNPTLYFILIVGNSYFKEGYSYNGGVMNTYYDLALFFENCVFFNNSAHLSPNFMISYGKAQVFLSKNLYYKNWPKASEIFSGGTLISCLSEHSKLYLYRQIMVNNSCYDGIVSMFSSLIYDFGSIYINNTGTTSPGFCHVSNTAFIMNSSVVVNVEGNDYGFLIFWDASESLLVNCKFKHIHAKSHAAFAHVQMNSQLNVSNCTFILNDDQSESFFFFLENKKASSIIENSVFYYNSFYQTNFDLFNSSLNVLNNLFIQNKGRIIFLDSESLSFFQNNTFWNTTSLFFEIFASQSGSLIIFSKNLINSLNSGSSNGGLFYVKEASAIIYNLNVTKINVKKFGSLVFAESASVEIGYLVLLNYNFNALNLKNCDMILTDSRFNNNYKNNAISSSFLMFGTIYLEDCYKAEINNCMFFENKDILKGGAIYVFSSKGYLSSFLRINNSLFYGNSAKLNGGSIYVSKTNVTINNSIFHRNSALNGGAIYFDSLNGI